MRSLALTLLAAATLGGCVIEDNGGADSGLTVRNQSDFTVEELYVTGVGNATWGPNLLGGDVLFPGESIVIGVDCGNYDAQLIDETGATCELHNLDLCFDDAVWTLRNDTCSAFSTVK